MPKEKTFAELQGTKVADMTGAELAKFNRITSSLRYNGNEGGKLSRLGDVTKGFFRKMGAAANAAAEESRFLDKKERIKEIREELGDLEEAHSAKSIGNERYELVKAQLNYELHELTNE